MPARKSTGKSSSGKSTSAKSTTKRAKKSTSSTATTEVSAPVEVAPEPVAPEPVVETVVEPPATESTSSATSSSSVGAEQLEADYQSLMTRLSEFKTLYTGITSDLRRMQKNMNKYIREANKRSRKPKNTDLNRPKRPPSGFAKPALISNELCSFLGVENGTEMARTEVTKHLTTYIKQHNLQDQENRRKILPDSKLQKLLNVKSTDEVTYFNLQKFMKVHFPKSASAIAAAASSSA